MNTGLVSEAPDHRRGGQLLRGHGHECWAWQRMNRGGSERVGEDMADGRRFSINVGKGQKSKIAETQVLQTAASAMRNLRRLRSSRAARTWQRAWHHKFRGGRGSTVVSPTRPPWAFSAGLMMASVPTRMFGRSAP